MAPALNDGIDRFNAVDALNLIAILLLAALVAFFRRQLGEAALWLVGVLASLLLFSTLAALLCSRGVIWRLMHDFSPALVLPVLFNTLGPLIDCTSPTHWDPTFAELDGRLFGDLYTLWYGALGRPDWLTDLTYLAYVGYYLAPVVLGAILYRHERQDFRRVVFTVALTFYASYVGYFIFPTLGPRVPAQMEAAVIGGGVLSRWVRTFLDFMELTRTDAFPSGHTAVALVCLYFGWQVSPAVFAIFVPLIAGIVFSTVYLHYHYVIDVVAGVGLAWGCAWLGPRLQLALEPREMMRRFALHLGMRE